MTASAGDPHRREQEEASARHFEWLKENIFAESDEQRLAGALRDLLAPDVTWFVETDHGREKNRENRGQLTGFLPQI